MADALLSSLVASDYGLEEACYPRALERETARHGSSARRLASGAAVLLGNRSPGTCLGRSDVGPIFQPRLRRDKSLSGGSSRHRWAEREYSRSGLGCLYIDGADAR
jgi:hypothetical protein